MTRAWAWEWVRIMRNPLVVLWRWLGAPSATLVGDGGSAAAGNAGVRCLGSVVVTGYDNSCKRKRGPGCSSPSTGLDGGETQRRRRRAPAVGRGRSFTVRALQGSSERLDPSGWLAVLLRRGYGG